MTFPRVNPGSWALGAILTPAQLNALDIDHAATVDGPQLTLAVASLSASTWARGGANTNNIKRGCYSPKDQAWFAVGDGGNDFGEVSYDYGKTWTNLALGLTLVNLDAAVSSAGAAAGKVAIVTTSRTVVVGSRSAYGSYSWLAAPLALSAAPTVASVDYEATSGTFVAVYRVGATGMRMDTALDPSGTWTARLLPATWSGYVGTTAPEVTCAAGVAVAVFADASKLNVIYSSNGGVTWTQVQLASQALTSGFTGIVVSKPAYDAVLKDWFVALSSSGAAPSTEVFRSSDGGASWVSTFYRATDITMNDIAAVGSLLVMTNSDGRVFVSLDRGVTWRHVSRLVGTATRWYVRSGGGGFMSWNSADKTTFASVRCSDAGVTL